MIDRADLSDANACVRIYAPYVEQTVVTLETVTPTVAEFASRISELGAVYPFLTWKEDGAVRGFIYGRRFRERTACDWICESSIYLDSGIQGKGVGRQLYTKFFECLRRMNVVSVIGITRPATPSAEFHRRVGFASAGVVPRAAFKLGQWCDLQFWHHELVSPPPVVPEPLIPFSVIASTVMLNEL